MSDEETETSGFDPVTFGVFGVLGGTGGFVWPEYAPLFISGGLVLGLSVPVKMSRWLHW